MVADLEEQQTSLAEVALSDFRSKSLIALVGQYLSTGSVLDVGCGSGGLVAWLCERGHDARGIDSSDKIIEAARAFLRTRGIDEQRVEKKLLPDLLASGKMFDHVVSMDCLEHQADDRGLFDQLLQVTRPGGKLVITVPAVPFLFSERDRIVGHYRRYTPERLRMLAGGKPVRIEELRYWNLLGVAPTLLYAYVLRRAINEEFRYGKPSLPKRALRGALSTWFEQIENKMRPPIGLTLFFVATRL